MPDNPIEDLLRRFAALSDDDKRRIRNDIEACSARVQSTEPSESTSEGACGQSPAADTDTVQFSEAEVWRIVADSDKNLGLLTNCPPFANVIDFGSCVYRLLHSSGRFQENGRIPRNVIQHMASRLFVTKPKPGEEVPDPGALRALAAKGRPVSDFFLADDLVCYSNGDGTVVVWIVRDVALGRAIQRFLHWIGAPIHKTFRDFLEDRGQESQAFRIDKATSQADGGEVLIR